MQTYDFFLLHAYFCLAMAIAQEKNFFFQAYRVEEHRRPLCRLL
jgi:hypothetical protein